MSRMEISAADPVLKQLIAQAVTKHEVCSVDAPSNWLLVDVARQRLVLLRDHTPIGIWPVSTAAVGLDSRQDSGGTPAGLHRLAQKIGTGCPVGTIFVSRQDTNRVWQPGVEDDRKSDLVLTRILTLDGCDPGLNRGPGIDSRERFIYLHGTNHEDRIGEPVSGGCVRLANTDILEVFDLVSEGDPVVII